MTVFRHAWRNLWRNPRRTVITLAAVGLTSAVLIVTFALSDGIMQQMLSNTTNLVVGEIQVHAPKYLVDRSIYKSIKDPDRILETLRNEHIPAVQRSYGYGLAAHETKSAGALFWGVDPVAEKRVFDLADHVAEGSFLSDSARKGVVIGRKLARSLNVDVGDEMVVVVQAADGSLGNELYTVTGILAAAGDQIDRTAAILNEADFNDLFVAGGRIQEIAVNTRSSLPLETAAAEVAAAAPGEDVKTWRELLPALSDLYNLFDVSMALFFSIFFLAAALGVMNTMLMATFERIREFGLLKALGATPWRIVRDVAAEALVLGIAASLMGGVIGLAASIYLAHVGIDTASLAGGYTISGVAFDPIWRAAVSTRAVAMPVLVMWGVCLLASLYPAILTARLDPVKAMTHV